MKNYTSLYRIYPTPEKIRSEMKKQLRYMILDREFWSIGFAYEIQGVNSFHGFRGANEANRLALKFLDRNVET